jgi:hypothetical protein
MGKYLRIIQYIRKPFLIYDFATAPGPRTVATGAMAVRRSNH